MRFVSVNNGVFICEACDLIHKTLGSEISLPLHVGESNFSKEHERLMAAGGNAQFKEFISYYADAFPELMNPSHRYLTNACVYYRLKLVAISKGDHFF